MKYKELYDEDFLDKFGEHKDTVSNLELGNNQQINVQSIAEACGITVKFDTVEHSGWSINSDEDENTKEIIINELEPEYRQRFTIGHEIGHIVLGHKGKSYRTSDMTKYIDTLARMHEVEANNFSAELIMPKRLVWNVLLETVDELEYSRTQNFDDQDIQKLIKYSAEKMKVSEQALGYRVKNLKVFIDE
ncbi:ImmA/IrrE family metallo-endopeptidase [Lactococcus sp. S47]|uniref:ImmA/IrrE family metallo-endopeptidase n=1 Tax=Lactococcus sp. S47 TaxID=2767460 RepID=UPI0019056301|nr:ImmA/IrrE family metallo-endopeptidase [Lactococcus sp. S47]MBK0029264.1 ImmA/IrrE family metallo-endopeptidase [Lactococcus sp. S47]